jgi:hypothetical protein
MPFDLRGMNLIKYDHEDVDSVRKAKSELIGHFKHFEEQEWESYDNPIVHALYAPPKASRLMTKEVLANYAASRMLEKQKNELQSTNYARVSALQNLIGTPAPMASPSNFFPEILPTPEPYGRLRALTNLLSNLAPIAAPTIPQIPPISQSPGARVLPPPYTRKKDS